MSVGIAILGAGIFAREEHLPAILATPGFTLKAVYSRSQSSAQALVSSQPRLEPATIAVYHDSPAHRGHSLADLLARPDIVAVAICLPIPAQASVIKQALAAGKHVLSEKPIAKDVATARELVAVHCALSVEKKPIWAVGENLRFLESFRKAAEMLREIGGEVTTFSMEMFSFTGGDDKYFNTAWRRVPDYQGGFLLDGGIHFVAALRLLLSATGSEIASVLAHTCLLEEHLPPVDTVHAVLTTSRGRSGTFSLSFGTKFRSGFSVRVATTKGSVEVGPTELVVRREGRKEEKLVFQGSSGVEEEMRAFSEGIEKGEVHPSQSAREALSDLEVLESLLVSGQKGVLVKLGHN